MHQIGVLPTSKPSLPPAGQLVCDIGETTINAGRSGMVL
jgi:hypothetical protein